MQEHQADLVESFVCKSFNEIRSVDRSFDEGIDRFESRSYSAA